MDFITGKGIAALCSICTVSGLSQVIGLPENDLISGVIGAFLSLAFVKPYHWGDWINYPPQKTVAMESLFWLRRAFLITFILVAVAIVMTSVAQAIKPDHLDSRVFSLLLSATGQACIPAIIKRVTKAVK